MNEPTLSVYIPNYNHAHFIDEAIDSILSQSRRPDEFIIVDDASTDNSLEVIRSYISREPLIQLYQNEKNLGVNKTVNRCLEIAKGDYVFSCSADDIVLPGCFEKSMNILKKYPQAGLCCFDIEAIDVKGNHLRNFFLKEPDVPEFVSHDRLLHYFRKGWDILPPIYKRSAVIEMGGYHLEHEFLADWFISFIIAYRHGVCFIPEPLAAQRSHETQYCIKGSRDLENLLNVQANILYHFKSERFAGIIPGEFYEHCVGFFSNRVDMVLRSNLHVHQACLLEESNKIKKRFSPFDALTLRILKLVMKIERIIVFLYCRRDFRKELLERARELRSTADFKVEKN